MCQDQSSMFALLAGVKQRMRSASVRRQRGSAAKPSYPEGRCVVMYAAGWKNLGKTKGSQFTATDGLRRTWPPTASSQLLAINNKQPAASCQLP